MKNATKIVMAVLAALAFEGLALAQSKTGSFKHDQIYANQFHGDGAAITNINPANVVGGALVGSAIGSTVQAYSANLTPLALNNGVGLTNIPAAGVQGTAVVGTDIGSTVQAHSSALDTLALNNGGSLTNLPAGTGATVGGHTIYVFTGSTCDAYAVSSDGSVTNYLGTTYP